MNGAELLIGTAAKNGVDVCFANPGTTEMPLVQAMDAMPEMRPVLGLFEGVCTGAADGFGRMAEGPPWCCCTWGPGWPTAYPTFTTPAGRAPRFSRWLESIPPGIGPTILLLQ